MINRHVARVILGAFFFGGLYHVRGPEFAAATFGVLAAFALTMYLVFCATYDPADKDLW